MERIHLRRTIQVHCWRVSGQIAKAAKRPDLMPVLLRARESGGTDPSDVAEHLLFEPSSRRVVAERLLRVAVLYRLLEQEDGRYVLTESGHAAVDEEQVLVPEHGTWTVWASDDPLFATPVLRVEPWSEPNAYSEVRGEKRDSAGNRRFATLPWWLREAVGVVAVPLVGGAPLRIDELKAEGEVAEPEATLRAEWDVSGARLRVRGTLGDAQVDTALDAPRVAADEVWLQLLQAEGLAPQWDPTTLALRVGVEETAPHERESMVRAVGFHHPRIAGLGAFDPTTVEGVALRPRTADDARPWAEWRLSARVRDYATAGRFSQWTAEAVAPFAEFEPSVPTRPELAGAAWRERPGRPTPAAWHLVAAEDWSL